MIPYYSQESQRPTKEMEVTWRKVNQSGKTYRIANIVVNGHWFQSVSEDDRVPEKHILKGLQRMVFNNTGLKI